MADKDNKKKKKGGGPDFIWLAILPILLVLSILLALTVWSKAENHLSSWFGEEVLQQLEPDEVFDILED